MFYRQSFTYTETLWNDLLDFDNNVNFIKDADEGETVKAQKHKYVFFFRREIIPSEYFQIILSIDFDVK